MGAVGPPDRMDRAGIGDQFARLKVETNFSSSGVNARKPAAPARDSARRARVAAVGSVLNCATHGWCQCVRYSAAIARLLLELPHVLFK